ncbi:MAG: UDP-N-acetylmuramoyl-tripeptide--D-alanyl-D-alanine ligase [Holosporales bacterium]
MAVLWSSADIVAAVAGRLEGAVFEASRIVIDSRTLQKGDFFVALKGPVADGHDYLAEAAHKGAAGALVHRFDTSVSLPQVVVGDTYEGLCQLAHAARERSKACVVAVTGSFGKTSTKEALRLMLQDQGQVTANDRSFNNHWGVPYTLANLGPSDDYGVFEVGMNHAGEITPLSMMVRPHVALITTIGEAHIENLGSLEAIADAKAEIFAGMEPGNTAVLNADNPHYQQLREKALSKGLQVLAFGRAPDAEAQILEVQSTAEGQEIQAEICGESLSLTLQVTGEHWAHNMLGALTAVWATGADVHQAAKSLQAFRLLSGRGERHRVALGAGEILVIDESYNASPSAMLAAIDVLQQTPIAGTGRRIAVLGDMLELGEDSAHHHQRVAEALAAAGIDAVFTSGPRARVIYDHVPPAMRQLHHEDVSEVAKAVAAYVRPGDVVMVKGSRGQRAYEGRMSTVVKALLALSQGPGQARSA